MLLLLASCGDDDITTGDPNTDPNTDPVETTIIQEAFFNSSSLMSFETVTATLEDGTSAECYQLTFSSNPVESGPFCPRTIDDVAGLGFYDGDTNPGLRVWSRQLLEDIENDGFNMVDDDGTVHVDFLTGMPDLSISNCLEATPDDDLLLTFLIPVEPKLGTSNDVIEEVEIIGVSTDGVPINGDPPSAVNGPSMMGGGPGGPGGAATEINFPSLDPCGGHHDPSGYYHWHFVPQVINQVLSSNGIDEVSCTLIDQTTSMQLFGFAKDGFPIYAYAVEPDDLDDCGGRTGETTEYPDGVYHYVASTTEAANVPKCLKGVAARGTFEFR
ncbi:YHYH protein [Saprospiraceae bacterium]|nr:YHYH protein [Saprospiraceae bacterium]